MMKKFIQNHTGVFIVCFIILLAAAFWIAAFLDWGVLTNGDFSIGGDKYHLNSFGSYTMTDSENKVHTGKWGPESGNLFTNSGMYLLTPDDGGEAIRVKKAMDDGKNVLAPLCPVCHSIYVGPDRYFIFNNRSVLERDICLDCINAKNRCISLSADGGYYDEKAHVIDGKCDICGKDADYTDEYEEYCPEHFGNLIDTVKNCVPKFMELDTLTIKLADVVQLSVASEGSDNDLWETTNSERVGVSATGKNGKIVGVGKTDLPLKDEPDKFDDPVYISVDTPEGRKVIRVIVE